jgi:hypothetical protein
MLLTLSLLSLQRWQALDGLPRKTIGQRIGCVQCVEMMPVIEKLGNLMRKKQIMFVVMVGWVKTDIKALRRGFANPRENVSRFRS